MKNIIFLSLLFITNSYSQSCGNLADGTVTRLDTENKSLQNARIQDQDGLGTCFANLASLMLHSALPDNPDVSYLSLALGYAELNKDSDSFAYKKDGKMLIWGGLTCETIMQAKKNGGVCNRSDVPLENVMFNPTLGISVDTGHNQKLVFDNVSKYFDEYNKIFTEPTKAKKEVTQDLISPEMRPGQESKKEEKESGFFTKLSNFFSSIFGSSNKEPHKPAPIIDLSKPVVKEEPVLKNNSTTQDPPTPASNKPTKDDLRSEYKLALKNLLDNKLPEYTDKACKKFDPKNAMEVSKSIVAYIMNTNKIPNFNMNISKIRNKMYSKYFTIMRQDKIIGYEIELSNEMLEAINSTYSNLLLNKHQPIANGKEALTKAIRSILPNDIDESLIKDLINKIDPNIINLIEDDFRRYTLDDKSKCSSSIDYLKNDDGLIKDFQNDECLKNYQNLGEGIRQIAVGLEKTNITDVDRLTKFITESSDLDYEKAFSDLLAPTCTDDKKIPIPSSLNCKENSIYLSPDDRLNEFNYAKKMNEIKKDFFNVVTKSLTTGKVVGLYVCTKFFKEDINYNSNKEDNCKFNDIHNNHAVGVIGYKCEKGKILYLVQNSWGEWGDLNPKYPKAGPGKAWFTEEDLLNNSYNYTTFE